MCATACSRDFRSEAISEAVAVHDFNPGFDEVVHELGKVVILGVKFAVGTKDGVGTENQIYAGGCPDLTSAAAFYDVVQGLRGWNPLETHVGEVDKEIVAEYAFTMGENTMFAVLVIAVEHAKSANERGHFGSSQPHELCAV